LNALVQALRQVLKICEFSVSELLLFDLKSYTLMIIEPLSAIAV